MTRRLVLSYLSVALFVLLVLELPLGINFARAERERLITAVERDAYVIGSLVEDRLQFGATDADPHLGTYPARTGSRVLIVDREGRTVHDSDAPGDPDALERDYSTRPEIITALRGQRTAGTRHSETLGHGLLYVAVPVASGGAVHGAVRITYPTAALEARIARNWVVLGGVALVVLAMTAVLGAAIARWLVRPTRSLERAVARLAEGDLDVRAPADRGPPEHRQLARGFNTMAQRLAGSIRAQQRFVSDASHQLRSPLTALRLELEELQLDADHELAAGIERAIGETRRLSRLVTDLLELARADAASPQRGVEEVGEVLRDRVAVWSSVAQEHGVSLQPELDAAVPVEAVPGHLAQILDNLLDNAIEASPEGSLIRVRSNVTGGRVEIHVVDEGPGMSEEARTRAFDRFWRSPDARPGSGTGLGLAIARQLARLSGGDVELRVHPDGGTDAVIVLDRADPTSVGERRSRTRSTAGHGSP